MRALLSIAAKMDWALQQLDVKNAFLLGDLEKEVFMELLLGFEDQLGRGKVCRLNKSLYDLKQSLRAWFEKFTLSVKSMGYTQRADQPHDVLQTFL